MNLVMLRRVWWMLAGADLLVVALIFAGWYATGHRGSELAGWIEAVGTLAAFVAASIAGVLAARAFILESRREQRIDDDRRREQASQVSVWVAPGGEGAPTTRYAFPTGGARSVPSPPAFVIRNSSSAPVYAVQIAARIGIITSTVDLDLLPPTGDHTRDVPFEQDLMDVIFEHHAAALEKGVMQPTREDPEPWRAFAGMVTAAITFHDAAGRYWHRFADGRLEEWDPYEELERERARIEDGIGPLEDLPVDT